MFFIGIDVSKSKLDCSLLLDAASSSKRKTKSVANSKAGVADLLVWVAKQGVTLCDLHAILEGTGVYHETAAFSLHHAGVTVSIVNPAQVRDFARGLAVRTKTDSVDSWVLARYGALVRPKPWTPPLPKRALYKPCCPDAKPSLKTCSASVTASKRLMPPIPPP